MFLASIAFIILLSFGGAESAAAQTTDFTACSGYAERRVYLESQAWWLQTPGKTGTNFGHVHAGTCFPLNATLRGTMTFTIRSVMHDNPGKLTSVRVQITDGTGSSKTLATKSVSRTCTGTCEWFDTLTVDTTKLSYDGRAEFRFHAEVSEPDGNKLLASSGYQAYVINGKPYKDYRSTDYFTEGRGWYTDHGYTIARLSSAFPFQAVRGTWSPKVDLKPGAGGDPTTSHDIRLDADFHHGVQGTILRKGTGQYVGSLTIDTTKLANGKHKLQLITESANSSGSTEKGILIIPFTVQN